MKISRDLSTIARNQKYFRTREIRNFSTVKSTEGRIFNFSVVVSGMMVAMAGLQVFIVRFFFQGARKGRWSSSWIFVLFFGFFYLKEFPWADDLMQATCENMCGSRIEI